MSANSSVLEHNLHHQFTDRGYLELALTHRSAEGANNERLEFLGDAVLGAVVAEFLYRQFLLSQGTTNPRDLNNLSLVLPSL